MDTDPIRHHDGPVDPAAAATLAATGLQLRTVANDGPGFAGWSQAAARGFLDPERTPAQVDASAASGRHRRLIGVFDPDSPLEDVPVGTFATWLTELTVPGGRTVPMLAVSAVTVAPTHRGRGIARAMMEGELRHAARSGVPVAGLTASESTLYGRYGFAPAAWAATWRIEARRAGWVGPDAPGRVDFVSREVARHVLPLLHERIRPHRPGEIAVPDGVWDRLAGVNPAAENPGRIRAVQYTDVTGQARGILLYTATENEDDYTKSSVHVVYLLAEDRDAYAALWRYVLELPLIGTVTARELAVDEPLLWMIADQRAAQITLADHHWIRLLDVPAALAARGYDTPGALAVDIDDPLGLTGGRWLLESAGGEGRVRPDDGPDAGDVPLVRAGVAELSAVYLGGVCPAALAAAGRIEATDATAAAHLFAARDAPRLSIWY
ncbi:GNAT family N-acetyltransferase [Microbacterium luticocti]|uniref:GNAT family N-acetyltransferase n=1 Tax=Microbacterium luticocti TaxID=451764 RepID=UPI00042241A1|nr:GNAT family N-acetyltransferase [Microbacterium luticocti]